MTLYETIFARRSVRQYADNPLDSAEIDEINCLIKSQKQLSGQTAEFEIADADKLKNSLAPHSILAFSHSDDAAWINVGYTLQGIDLRLQSNGYGTIWQGMAKPKKHNLDYRILLGFGKTDIPLRKSESEFRRKKLNEISNENNNIAKAARVAPSGVNFQPWNLNFSQNSVTINANVHGLGHILPGKTYLIDLGIVLKHVEIALEHEGKTIKSVEIAERGKDSAITVIW